MFERLLGGHVEAVGVVLLFYFAILANAFITDYGGSGNSVASSGSLRRRLVNG